MVNSASRPQRAVVGTFCL